MQKTDFPLRAVAIAESVAAHEPHVVGLQEMILLRQDPSNFALNPMPDAEALIRSSHGLRVVQGIRYA